MGFHRLPWLNGRLPRVDHKIAGLPENEVGFCFGSPAEIRCLDGDVHFGETRLRFCSDLLRSTRIYSDLLGLGQKAPPPELVRPANNTWKRSVFSGPSNIVG